MLMIRLARTGAKKKPHYRVVVIEKERPRDGRFHEIVGQYNPKANPPVVKLEIARIQHWISKGARTSERVRRLMEKHKGATLELTAGECMTRTPVTIGPKELASVALNLMERRKILAVVVADEEKRTLGVVHLHDLWTLELI